MPRFHPWRPSFRCMRCRRLVVLDGLRAWLFQPPAMDGGKTMFVCRDCRRARGEEQRW